MDWNQCSEFPGILNWDKTALDILARRKEFYENLVGAALEIQIHHTNAFEFDYASAGPFAAVHSLFSFKMMQASSGLLARILPTLCAGARLAIQDGNNLSWLARYVPNRRRVV